MDKRKSTGRTRNWATIVYPESAPENWMMLLDDLKVPALISPLHDSDLNATGEPKKAHYHVILAFDSVKSRDQVEGLFKFIGGVGCERVESMRYYARYLCHLDNDDKHQYSIEDVKVLGGLDYLAIIASAADKYEVINQIVDFCETNQIYSFAKLFVYARDNKPEWFRIICDHNTLVIKEYLKSKWWDDHQA